MRYELQLERIEKELAEIDEIMSGPAGLSIRANYSEEALLQWKAVREREHRLMAERNRCEARMTPKAYRAKNEREAKRYMRQHAARMREMKKNDSAETIFANVELHGFA